MAKVKNSKDGIAETPSEEEMTSDALDATADGTEPLSDDDPMKGPSDTDDTPAEEMGARLEEVETPDPEEIEAAAEDHSLEAEDDTPREEVLDERVEPNDYEEQMPAAPVATAQRSSIWPAVFGGVIAAVLGFIAGRGDQLDAFLPVSMHRQSVDLAPLTQQTATLSARLDVLETAAPDQELVASIDALQTSVAEIDDVNAALAELTQRVEAIEAQPVETIIQRPVENEQTAEEIATLQSAVGALQSQIAEDEARAKSEAERLLAQAALMRVVTAVESGGTFVPALEALEEVTPVDIPDALRSAAVEGVPSMSALRESFPEAARSAIAAARAEVPETDVVGVGGFLRRQLNARSVTPREGDSADAVLSRAEAALKAGDLEETLVQLEALPDVATTAMQPWLDVANTRQNARNAAQDLADSLTVN